MKIKKMIHNSIVGEVNTYILIEDNCFIIDPGFFPKKIMKFIDGNQLTVLGILLTHAHFDHAMQIYQLSEYYSCPVYLHELELQILENDALNGVKEFHITNGYNQYKPELKLMKHQDVILFDNNQITCLHTPGHTIGGMCYVIDNCIFTGDTLFKGTIGRYDLPTGNKFDLFESLRTIISNTQGSTKVYPGHGENTTIEYELENNVYMKKI